MLCMESFRSKGSLVSVENSGGKGWQVFRLLRAVPDWLDGDLEALEGFSTQVSQAWSLSRRSKTQ
jgi:GAF domain-containing protein